MQFFLLSDDKERVDAILHFHDGEEHVENLINCVTGEGLPGTSHSKPSIFYRHLEPRCYGGILMAEQRQGLTQLVANYRSEERRVGKECRSRRSPYH